MSATQVDLILSSHGTVTLELECPVGGRANKTDVGFEIGLPRALVQILGRLSPVPVPSGHVVVPFVGVVAEPFTPQNNEAEVKSILTPTLQQLIDPQVYKFAGMREWQGRRYALHEFNIHQPPLWGATARMVHDLLHRMQLVQIGRAHV